VLGCTAKSDLLEIPPETKQKTNSEVFKAQKKVTIEQNLYFGNI
jgi:hypothetical protein